MEIEFKHTPVFYHIYNTPRSVRYVVNEGGTRSSKTWSLLTYFLILCLSDPHARKTIQILRKNLTSCNRTVLKDFLRIVNQYGLIETGIISYNKTNSRFQIYSNIIEFRGANDPQNLRGDSRYIAWLNEANEFDLEDFNQIKYRTEAQIYLDYNPSFTDHWIYDMIEIESAGGDNDAELKKISTTEIMKICEQNGGVFESPHLKLIQSTYLDNPMLSEALVRDIERLKLYNDDDYNIYALGIRSNPAGRMFRKVYYGEYIDLPNDAIGVIYCDPNLSLKGKGDTTAIVKLYYSPSTQYFYISDVICRSFSNSNDLLNELFSLYSSNCRYIGFDGNFAQESTWTQHVENYSRLKGKSFPFIEYMRYSVDMEAKLVQYLWNDRQFYFNKDIAETEDGKRFFQQLYLFNGKRNTLAGTHDDAPDALICAVKFIHDKGFVISGEATAIIGSFFNK